MKFKNSLKKMAERDRQNKIRIVQLQKDIAINCGKGLSTAHFEAELDEILLQRQKYKRNQFRLIILIIMLNLAIIDALVYCGYGLIHIMDIPIGLKNHGW